MRKIVFTKQQERNIEQLYKQGSSVRQLAKQLDMSRQTATRHLQSKSIKIRYCHPAVYNINDTYFDSINNGEKAYWLGFLYADGCVQKWHLSIKLAEKDKKHLELFKKCIESNHPLLPLNYDNRHKHYAYMLSIGNKHLITSLTNSGCTPRKTLILRFPQWLPRQLQHDFVRGYFDGDGSIGIYRNNQASISICGTDMMLQSIQDILLNECQIAPSKLYKTKNIYILQHQGNNIVRKIKNYLYVHATIYLERKKDIFDKIKKAKNGDIHQY